MSTHRQARFRERYGPWALVAGASEGLGEAFARGAAARGLNVVLVARRADKLEALAAALGTEYGVQTRTLALDMAAPDFAEALGRGLGDIDVGLLVCNAAYSVIAEFLDVPAAQHQQEIAVNCAGTLGAVHLLAGPMRDRRRGGIIIVSSLSGFQGSALIASYAATKAFGIALAEGLHEELGHSGVDVLCTCPGATRTPNYEASQPGPAPALAPKVMAPQAVADDALRALGRRHLTIPGLGNRLSSFLLRRLMSRHRALKTMARATRQIYGGEA